ncbi:MAG: amidohydrolase [Acidimicrobiales bacterium]|nr:amidohydrolase [Acidimicrobiales bacterium]
MTTGLGIIDTDAHVIEAADLWTGRMSTKKWGDLVPHVKWEEDKGLLAWYVGDTRVVPALAGTHGVWDEPYPSSPPSFEAVHHSTWDPVERAKVMDEMGVQMAALYPNLSSGFSIVCEDLDPEFRNETVRAYNDFIVEWTSAAPDRFLRIAIVPYWSPAACVEEIERCAELGFHGITTTGMPHLHGQPFLADRQWDPMWRAAEEAGLPVSFHVGNGKPNEHLNERRMAVEGSAAAGARGLTSQFFDNAMQLTDLLFSGVLARFPGLSFVIVESGIGWIPFCLEACDYHFGTSKVSRQRPEFEMLPSEYFHRQVFANYWFEELEQWHVDRVGEDNILFETDYPHGTSLRKDGVDRALANGLARVRPDVRAKILHDNATRLYRL